MRNYNIFFHGQDLLKGKEMTSLVGSICLSRGMFGLGNISWRKRSLLLVVVEVF